jgi:putative colanic acid biosynthesis glycosyltransferase
VSVLISQVSPWLSIVTVTYNAARELSRTRDSIRSQNFHDYEWIVVDGASVDGTRKILEQDSAISVWRSERDNGIYDAMNKGVGLANGRYLLFLNAGDVFPAPSTLQEVAKFLAECNDQCDVLYGGANLVFPDGRKHYRPPRKADSYIWHGLPANHQATYYRRTVLGANPYDLKYKICGDYYLAAKLHMMGVSTSYLNSSLVEFFIGGRSLFNPLTAIKEPFVIQSEILRLSTGLKIVSIFKRVFAILITYLLFKIGDKAINVK